MKLEIVESTHTDDKTGRAIITYRPTLTASVTATGTLTFAAWQVFEDDKPTEKARCKRAALCNAREIISSLQHL